MSWLRKNRKWVWITTVVFATLIIAAGVYVFYLYNQVDQTVSKMYVPLESDIQKKQVVKETMEKKEPINVLLLGVDERVDDQGRSDTMIFASLNPNTNKILMFSIPRDTYVEIPGYGQDKINHAYAFGGPELSIQTVENFLDTTIHFYTRVNMEGFKDGVDAVGGVTVQNDFAFSSGGQYFPEGEIYLEGEDALNYARMRKKDPDGDFGRTERQREVLQAALDKALSFDSFTKFNDILDTVGDNVKTNMDIHVMKDLFLNYRDVSKKIVTEHISGYGQFIGDIWYLMLEEQEVDRIRSLIHSHVNKG